MNNNLVTVSPGLLCGTPVFKGTRVPVESLFDHLASGATLDEFLEDFPSVTREQAVGVLASAESAFCATVLHENSDR